MAHQDAMEDTREHAAEEREEAGSLPFARKKSTVNSELQDQE